MENRKKSGRSGKSRKSRKTKKVEVKLADRDRIENEVHNLLPDNRKVVRSEAKKLFEEEESDCITDRTPETPYNSDKELEEEALRKTNELNHNDLLAALNMVENNSNMESNKDTKTVQSTYEPIDNVTLQTAIPLIPFPPPTNGPPLPQKFSLGVVRAPPHVMSVQPSDSNSSLSSKTGDARPHTYSSSLGGSLNSTTSESSSSMTSLNSKTGSIYPSSQNDSITSSSSISDISIASATGISLPSSVSNISLKSETGSNASGIRSDRSENMSVTGIPSPASLSSTSLISQTFPPMSSSTSSSSLVSQTMSPLKESTMEETTEKIKSPAIPIIKLPHSIPSTTSTTRSQTGSPIRSVNSKMPIDGHTSSIRSPNQYNPSPDTRMDINPSSQTPVREKPQDFSQRAQPISNDSSLYQPSGWYNSKGEFFPGDQTLDDIPDIPSEKSEQSPPMVTAKESLSSTSLSITSLPDKIYGDVDDEIGAKSDKQFVGRMTLKKNKKNEAGFEFEAKDPSVKSKPRTPRKLKITNIFGGADRKYIPPVRRKTTARSKPSTVPYLPPPLPDDSRAQLTTVAMTPKVHRNTDLVSAPSLPLSVTKKTDRSIPSSCLKSSPITDATRALRTTVTDREDLKMATSLPLSVTKKSDRSIPSSYFTSSNDPTPIHLLRTENSLLPSNSRSNSLLPSITHSPTPTTSPAAKSPITLKKGKKIEKTPNERILLSPVANSPIHSKKKSKKRREKKKSSQAIERKNGKIEQKNTPNERVVYREKPVSPTIGTPKRQWRDIHKKKKETEDESKKERERTKKSDKKSNTIKERNASDKTNDPFYQQLVYSSYVTNGLNVACYNYDEREVEKKKSAAIT